LGRSSKSVADDKKPLWSVIRGETRRFRMRRDLQPGEVALFISPTRGDVRGNALETVTILASPHRDHSAKKHFATPKEVVIA
jgi:hypothetical protein